jgi:hypothetical protein
LVLQLAASIEPDSVGKLMCEVCGVPMRLYGVEPHPTIDGADLWTYVCPRCERVQTGAIYHSSGLRPDGAFDADATTLLGSTFDAAWEALAASDSLPADAQHEAAAREMLARCVIEVIQQGETDTDRLAEHALDRLLRNKP